MSISARSRLVIRARILAAILSGGAACLLAAALPKLAHAQAGLVAAYGFNESSGSTVSDASGNGNTGTFASGVSRTTSGKFGSALAFSGGFVTIPHAAALSLTTGMTLEAWVFPTSRSSYSTVVMEEQPGDYVYTLYASAPSTPSAEINISALHSGERAVASPSTISLNAWTHLAATFDGNTLRLFVNGAQAATRAISNPIMTSSSALRIGGNTIWGEFFSGRIDEVRIYNRALSSSEIQGDMTTPVGTTPPVDETAPTIAITSPTGSGMYTTNAATVSLSGNAADNVGVTQVSWVNDRGGAGTASGTTSWSASGIALQPGANVLTVTAADAAGNTGTARLTVTLDATAPTVAITGPGAGATVSGSNVSVAVTATDDRAMGGVTLLVDGVATGSEVTGAGPSYTLSWNSQAVANGPHTLSARARDAAGNTAVAPEVVVTVANTQAAGLVAAYSFNETTGTTVNDASGNNNAGTLGTGVTRTTSGRFGGALTFANGYVTVPHAASLNLTTGMTLEAWLFPTTVANWATAVMKEQPGEFVYSLYAAAPQTPGGYFNVGSSGSTERQVNAPASLAVNNWTHVAATFDGSTSRLYINGSEVANHDFSGPIATSTGALRIGGNAVWGEFFSGRIDEVRIYNRALSPAEILADMSTPVGSAGEDTTPPVVAVVSPAAGATVSGNVVLSATASDNFGVAGVKFLIDGVPQSVESVMPPYTANWDASAVAPGLHTVEALARDFAGNTSRSGVVSVNVLPSQASTLGQWSAPFNWPLIPITSVLLKTGEVMGWEYDGAGGPYLWNPLTNQFTPIHNTSNLFCGGQVALPDGRIFIAGGHVASHVGLAETNIFDPVARTWSVGPNMAVGRWYPTVTTLADGRALITEGETTCDGCNALIPEVYNPLTNQLTRLTSASLNIPYYPHMYLLPDGRLFAAGTAEAPIASRVLDLATQSWSVVDPTVVDGGSSVMYLPGKIMKSGTSHNPDLPADPSSANTYVIDMTSASPHWVQTAPMAFPRTYHNLTVLPDGDVLVTGGGRTSDAVDQAGGVLAAELWSPATQTYTTLASGQIARLYHSTALLLPDGRVLVTGGGRFNGFPSNDPSDHVEAEIFSPPYLYKGPRPTITSAPSDATYGSHITVQTPDTPDIASVSLIKLGAVTHAFNMEQRFIPLNFTAGSQQLDVEMPANGNLAPPGHYMLFIVNGNGVPSVATIVQIH